MIIAVFRVLQTDNVKCTVYNARTWRVTRMALLWFRFVNLSEVIIECENSNNKNSTLYNSLSRFCTIVL